MLHAQELLYVVADEQFYEDISNYRASDEFMGVVARMLPESWTTNRRSLWSGAGNPEVGVKRQGFKIHVSSISEHAIPILETVVPICVRRNTAFKYTADQRLLGIINSKNIDRGSAGKFITIYPHDEPDFKELIDDLYRATVDRGFLGQYVLSDRRYKDSRILYYRYGGMRPPVQLKVDGTKHSFLEAPDGSVVRDERLAYFNLPPWVSDPFGGKPTLRGNAREPLNGRFVIERMINCSNRGGVYIANDLTTESQVIVKEARPFVSRATKGAVTIDSVDFLEREWTILQRLEHLGCTPRPIALFNAWEHRFLVEEKIDGMPLRRFVTQSDNLVLPHIDDRARLDRFLPRYRRLADTLLAHLRAIHREGVVLGDLSLGNVMVTDDLSEVRIIDVETASFLEGDEEFMTFAANWYTPGFGRPGRSARRRVDPADDFFALGMILLNLFIGGLQFFELKPDAVHLFLDGVVELGVPAWVRELVTAVANGDTEEASRVLSNVAVEQAVA